jgi:hypothetical protein
MLQRKMEPAVMSMEAPLVRAMHRVTVGQIVKTGRNYDKTLYAATFSSCPVGVEFSLLINSVT